ncbi:MAG: hypothetical protein EOP86_02165 [Verrucomicrobiaceae bacterium]|nr:MAG: hypothetical protein EOP86_02165 [Verrucomicrobiaceae bacterium]
MAHLHLLLATNSPSAILIKSGSRKGPNRYSCTVGWDRRGDTFQLGQCLRYRLQFADLSPDGQYFSYYVDTKNPLREHPCYSGISRSPWLKALTFWGRYPIQSLFLPDSSPGHPQICTFGERFKPDRNVLGVEMILDCPPEWKSFGREGIAIIQWLRDGWRLAAPWKRSSSAEVKEILGWPRTRGTYHMIFEKIPAYGWKLQMTHWHGNYTDDPDREPTFETFALVSPQNEVSRLPDWISADFDAPRDRVVWTAGNMLYAAPFKSTGLREAKMLWDGRELKFTPIEAPY